MDQALCRFGQIQLQMTAKPRVIIDDGQCHGTVPCALFVENADLGLVKIKVPEAMHMRCFEIAYFTMLTSFFGSPLSIGRLGRYIRLQPTVFAHATQHRFVAGHLSKMGLRFGHCLQVVIMQLNIPARVIFILCFQRLQ